MSTVTTADVVRSCNQSADLLEENFCAGYILGIFDELSLSRLVCPAAGFSTEQAMAIARKFLNDHPEEWNLAPSFLIGDAFKSAFPCESSTKSRK